MQILAFALCVVSFALLAVATSRQQEVIFRRKLGSSQGHIARIAGWCGLGLALYACVASSGWALGLVRYSGYTSLAAGLIYLGLIALGRNTRAGGPRPAPSPCATKS